jgi:hypothetical protein
MVFYPPAGMRYDNTVPAQCSASDVELELIGPAACPPGSRLGEGATEGLFYEPIGHSFVFDHYVHHMDVFNGPSGEFLLVQSEGYTVIHSHPRPDGSVEYDAPTCFPAPLTGQCPDDYVLQLKTTTVKPAYTTGLGRHLRSYATTPSTCPQVGYWNTTVRFWWADGSSDAVVSRQPCERPRPRHRSHPGPRKHRHNRAPISRR